MFGLSSANERHGVVERCESATLHLLCVCRRKVHSKPLDALNLCRETATDSQCQKLLIGSCRCRACCTCESLAAARDMVLFPVLLSSEDSRFGGVCYCMQFIADHAWVPFLKNVLLSAKYVHNGWRSQDAKSGARLWGTAARHRRERASSSEHARIRTTMRKQNLKHCDHIAETMVM